MKTATKNAVMSSQTLSRTVIEETPAKAAQFFIGSTKPEILRQLQAVGFTRADYEEGWQLFLRVAHAGSAPEPESPANKAAEAISEIQSWLGQGFMRVRAVWGRAAPEVLAYVFKDIDSSDNGAVYDLATFLNRCKDLQNGADRKATRKTDHAALEVLAQRGIGDATLKHLASLLELAQVQPIVAPIVVKGDARNAAVTELYLWLRDWRETARAGIKNRSQLISLGIAKRRAKKIAATPSPSPVTITPIAPPAPTSPILQLVSSTSR